MPYRFMTGFCFFAAFCFGNTSLWATQPRSLPPDVIQARHSEPRFTEEKISLTTLSGQALEAKVLVSEPREDGTHEKKLPALLVFGGFEDAAHVLELLEPKMPVVVGSFDYPFKPPRRFEFPESFKYAPEAKRAIQDTISGIGELVAALRKRPDVDPARIATVGVSFGAPFALAAAANDPSIPSLVLVQGFGAVPYTVEQLLDEKWQPYLGFLAQPAAWLVANLGWLYLDAPSPEDSAAKLAPTQRVLMITAENDTRLPKLSTESLWSALSRSRPKHEKITLPGDHLAPNSDKLIAEITGIVEEWLSKSEALK